MGGLIRARVMVPTVTPVLVSSRASISTVAGENYSGAEAWFQVYDGATNPPVGAPSYSWSADDHAPVSQALDGPDAVIPGELFADGCVVGWSSEKDSWVPVLGSIEVTGQYR